MPTGLVSPTRADMPCLAEHPSPPRLPKLRPVRHPDPRLRWPLDKPPRLTRDVPTPSSPVHSTPRLLSRDPAQPEPTCLFDPARSDVSFRTGHVDKPTPSRPIDKPFQPAPPPADKPPPVTPIDKPDQPPLTLPASADIPLPVFTDSARHASAHQPDEPRHPEPRRHAQPSLPVTSRRQPVPPPPSRPPISTRAAPPYPKPHRQPSPLHPEPTDRNSPARTLRRPTPPPPAPTTPVHPKRPTCQLSTLLRTLTDPLHAHPPRLDGSLHAITNDKPDLANPPAATYRTCSNDCPTHSTLATTLFSPPDCSIHLASVPSTTRLSPPPPDNPPRLRAHDNPLRPLPTRQPPPSLPSRQPVPPRTTSPLAAAQPQPTFLTDALLSTPRPHDKPRRARPDSSPPYASCDRPLPVRSPRPTIRYFPALATTRSLPTRNARLFGPLPVTTLVAPSPPTPPTAPHHPTTRPTQMPTRPRTTDPL